MTVIKSKRSTAVTLETEESGFYGKVSVGVKYNTDIFLGFKIFILQKMLSVTCKYVTQLKYISKTETKQK